MIKYIRISRVIIDFVGKTPRRSSVRFWIGSWMISKTIHSLLQYVRVHRGLGYDINRILVYWCSQGTRGDSKIWTHRTSTAAHRVLPQDRCSDIQRRCNYGKYDYSAIEDQTFVPSCYSGITCPTWKVGFSMCV